jgi:hypothetical protein
VQFRHFGIVQRQRQTDTPADLERKLPQLHEQVCGVLGICAAVEKPRSRGIVGLGTRRAVCRAGQLRFHDGLISGVAINGNPRNRSSIACKDLQIAATGIRRPVTLPYRLNDSMWRFGNRGTTLRFFNRLPPVLFRVSVTVRNRFPEHE